MQTFKAIARTVGLILFGYVVGAILPYAHSFFVGVDPAWGAVGLLSGELIGQYLD